MLLDDCCLEDKEYDEEGWLVECDEEDEEEEEEEEEADGLFRFKGCLKRELSDCCVELLELELLGF